MKKKPSSTEERASDPKASVVYLTDDSSEDSRKYPLPTGNFVGLDFGEKQRSAQSRSESEIPVLLLPNPSAPANPPNAEEDDLEDVVLLRSAQQDSEEALVVLRPVSGATEALPSTPPTSGISSETSPTRQVSGSTEALSSPPARATSTASFRRSASMTQDYPISSPLIKLADDPSSPPPENRPSPQTPSSSDVRSPSQTPLSPENRPSPQTSSSSDARLSSRQTSAIGSPFPSNPTAPSRNAANDLFPDIPPASSDQTIAYEAAHLHAILTPPPSTTLSLGLRPSFDDLVASSADIASSSQGRMTPPPSDSSHQSQPADPYTTLSVGSPRAHQTTDQTHPPQTQANESNAHPPQETQANECKAHTLETETETEQALSIASSEHPSAASSTHPSAASSTHPSAASSDHETIDVGQSPRSSELLRVVALHDGEVTDDLLRVIAQQHLDRATFEIAPSALESARKLQPPTDDLVAFALKQNERERAKPLLPTGEVIAYSLFSEAVSSPRPTDVSTSPFPRSKALSTTQAFPASEVARIVRVYDAEESSISPESASDPAKDGADTDERPPYRDTRDELSRPSFKEPPPSLPAEVSAKTSPDEIVAISQEQMNALLQQEHVPSHTLETPVSSPKKASHDISAQEIQAVSPNESAALSEEETLAVSDISLHTRQKTEPHEMRAVSEHDLAADLAASPQQSLHPTQESAVFQQSLHPTQESPTFEATSADDEIPVFEPTPSHAPVMTHEDLDLLDSSSADNEIPVGDTHYTANSEIPVGDTHYTADNEIPVGDTHYTADNEIPVGDTHYTADDLPMFEGTSADNEIPVADGVSEHPNSPSDSDLPWFSPPSQPVQTPQTIAVQRVLQRTDPHIRTPQHTTSPLSSPPPSASFTLRSMLTQASESDTQSKIREQHARNLPTPLSTPHLPTPSNAPHLPTPSNAPHLPTPSSTPHLPTPSSTPRLPNPLTAPKTNPPDTETTPFVPRPAAASSPAQRAIRVEVLRPGETYEEKRVADGVLLEGLLSELALHCGRACCFLLKEGALIGLGARGVGDVHRRILDILLPADAPSLFSHVIRTRSSYVGPPASGPIDRILTACLGGKEPQDIAIYPILQNQRVVALFYLDDAGVGHFPEDSEHIKALIRRAPLLSFHWSLEDLAALAEDLS
ncbi:hypothetical protein L6R29_24360 [Myxococcota bacterium]|nr:hypothetical protein [Myxococcota bacterium]